MSIFEQILGAINNPEKEASTNQLGSILDTVQQLSGNYQANPDAVQSAMSIVGNYTKSALQQQRSQSGTAQVNQLINQFGGTQANSQVLSTLFNSSQLQSMIQQISLRTGLDARMIQGMLPILVPLVLNFLKTGNNKGNIQIDNPVVSSFLDSDGDGDVDLQDALNMASRYLAR
ncbi:Bacterial protein of unknown function (DUF937) [Xenococcus sp. PCC 7305]|uniref:DUF937 domain-containing protein n=1 Tax=Xenococcus sp. PCC 7305 TaxID=102125 RepID=UPI0002AC7D75|nr:DUF937 domain-containing protein [Xenococcus sp. PCC 7305]ELS04034.1 Bacterial protein of unknown function (DUF937) [Xenococcus sp. PCC 7305]